MKKNLLIVIAIAAMLAVFSGCGGQKGSSSGRVIKQPYTIGFAQIEEASSWRTAETNSVEQAAKERGIQLKMAVGDQAKQIAAIRDFIAQGVSGILLAPQTDSGWDEVLKEAKDAGIPVVLLDRGLNSDPSLYVTKISSDFAYEGKVAAEWAIKKLGGKGNVVELFGDPAADPAKLRSKGFMDGIKGQSGIKVLDSQTGEWGRDKGKQVMEAWLTKGLKIDLVFAHNDDMALGAIDAIKAAGKKPGKDIIIVSVDAVKAAFEAIARGELNCTVECNPLLGDLGFDALAKALVGETVPKWIVQNDRAFDTTNYKDHATQGF